MIALPFALAAMTLVFSLVAPNFMTFGNITNIGRQISVLALLSWGQTLVILTAGIDLSVGAVVALVSVVAGLTFTTVGPTVGVPITLLVALSVGVANGVLVARTRITPFIVTLGTLSIASGLALTISGGVPIWGFPESAWYEIGNGYLLGIPTPIYVAALTYAIVWIFLTQTAFGLHVYALGDNEEASNRAGVNVGRIKLLVYAASGLLAGIGGLVLTFRVESGQPLLGTDLNLQSIAAVVLGGTSLFGGVGRLSGTLFGVVFIGVLANGLNILGISTFVQQIVIGATLLTAVYFTSRTTVEAS